MKLKQNHYWIGIILIGIIILFLMPVKTNGQNDKWFSKKDIAPMALTLGAAKLKTGVEFYSSAPFYKYQCYATLRFLTAQKY